MIARSITATAILLFLAAPANAQHEHHQPAPDAGWAWSVDSSVFLTANLQIREFSDFRQMESQNWLMGTATRSVGTGALAVHGMLSLEPFTLRDLGSSQVFQTGETFNGAPLIDYQHPHDLIMGLSAAYERPLGTATLMFRGGLVDAPALGPTPFMHRASALLHPTAPLAHHQLDSTHITHGVVTAGLRYGAWQLETSAFRGREPDEDRLRLDMGALDSASVRGGWIRGGTRAQVSVGWLEEPHASEPGDVTRVTASIEHERPLRSRPAAFTAAWGQNRERLNNEGAFLVESAIGLTRGGTGYLRGEIVEKHIIGAGAHPVGFEHAHVTSTVKALTLGYQHEIWAGAAYADGLRVGADVTAHATPENLKASYGQPFSFHVYARWTLRYPDRPDRPVKEDE